MGLKLGWNPRVSSSPSGRTLSWGMPTVGLLSWYTGLVYGITVFMKSFPPVSCNTTRTAGFPFPDMLLSSREIVQNR